MQTNIRGLVDRLELASARGAMPLFEAISNAIDAIHEKGLGGASGAGRIDIRVIEKIDLARQGGDDLPVIDGFEVQDNGIGFSDEHFGAFKEAYTLTKVKLGGKGVGRFTYLKVFGLVRVESRFEKSGEIWGRSFRFTVDKEVSEDQVAQSNGESGSRVRMEGLSERYRGAFPNEPDLLASKIIAHFLIRFASRSCPAIYLHWPGNTEVRLYDVFEKTVLPHIDEQSIAVAGQHIGIQAFRNKDGRARHEYHICANGRDVITGRLKRLLPEIPDRLLDEEQSAYTLIVLVTGEYFDEHANQERTSIEFQDDEEFVGDETLISRVALDRALTQALRDLLAKDLHQTHVEKLAQIERFVEGAPEYRVLTNERYRHLIEQQVQPGLSDEKLDEALLRIRRGIEDSVRREERNVASLMESASFEEYQDRIKRLMDDMNDVGKSKLADYVAHRRTILDLVDNSLKRAHGSEKYPLERVLHNMIFPMGYTSKDLFLDKQNLWLIDERLCFHTLLTSDRKLSSVPGLQETSPKEPDIFAFFYDTPIGVAEPGDLPGGSVVVIEFKRPGRDDYRSDPAEQVIQRFFEIQQGGVRDIDGRPINSKQLRYVGYLIADLTPSLRRHVAMRYHVAIDNEGYFATLAGGDGYIEIISYDKLIRDAKRRNRILFERLGIHKH